MESKKANLIIDVTKNIVEQYKKQLQESINEKKQIKDLDPYEYECTVTRAERCLQLVDKILNNFEKSIFDGEITDEETYQAIYTRNGRELRKILYIKPFSKEEREIELAKEGSVRVFEQIGIPKYAMYPLTADIMERYRDKNHKNEVLDEGRIQIFNKLFSVEGKYDVGTLYINNLLTTKVTADTNVLIYTNDKPVLYTQNKKLILDANEIKNIVDKYIKSELDDKGLKTLDDQNNFIHETFDSLKNIGNNGGGNSSIDYSSYYYEYFRSIFTRGYRDKKYYESVREIKNNSELDSLKQQKEMLIKLSELTSEEQKLNSRLMEILTEKENIMSQMLESKVTDEKSESKEDNSNIESIHDTEDGKEWISDTEYIENGTHYHLPDWKKIHEEGPHVILK